MTGRDPSHAAAGSSFREDKEMSITQTQADTAIAAARSRSAGMGMTPVRIESTSAGGKNQ